MKELSRKDKKTLIFLVIFVIGSVGIMTYFHVFESDKKKYYPVTISQDDIKQYGNNTDAVVIYPLLTQYAYSKHGFYAYYNGTCQTCTTVSISPSIYPLYSTGENGLWYLMKLGYPIITDLDVDRNPAILNHYDKIILLHNEYMTQKEFDAIHAQKNVIYLYPNSAYALVTVNYNDWTETLIKGHNYPEKTDENGFGFTTSSKFEYDLNCENYKWNQMPNGMQLTCFPEYLITYDKNLWQTIKDYPQKIPSLVPQDKKAIDISSIGYCSLQGTCKQNP